MRDGYETETEVSAAMPHTCRRLCDALILLTAHLLPASRGALQCTECLRCDEEERSRRCTQEMC